MSSGAVHYPSLAPPGGRGGCYYSTCVDGNHRGWHALVVKQGLFQIARPSLDSTRVADATRGGVEVSFSTRASRETASEESELFRPLGRRRASVGLLADTV